MDESLQKLRRRFDSNPNDHKALNDLVRAHAKVGDLVAAYSLLLDHGALERRDPLLLEIGRHLAVEQEGVLKKGLGEDTRYAVEKDKERSYRRWSTLR